MKETQPTTTIMPIDYLKIVFRRKWLLIGAIYIGLVVGIILSSILPKTYESYTVIMVEEGKIINPLISTLAVSTTMVDRMRTIQEQMLSWNSLTKLVKKLQLSKDIDSQYAYEQLILSLRKYIRVRLGGKNIIRISFTDKDPKKAQAVVKTITEIFINENIKMQHRETNDAINFINDQLKVYRKKIKEGEITALQEKLDNLLIDSTEKHPLVKQLRAKLTKAEGELASGNYDIAADTELKLNTQSGQLMQELEKISNSIDLNNTDPDGQTAGTVNDAVYKMLLVEKIGKTLKQDAKIDENIYNKLLQRLETAKITKRLDASTQGTRYTILDPPRLPIKPIKPNKTLVVLMGIFLGASAGAAAILLTEFMDQSFLGVDEAKAALGLPILGGISRIVTVEDINREKWIIRKRIILFLITGAALIVIIAIFSLLQK